MMHGTNRQRRQRLCFQVLTGVYRQVPCCGSCLPYAQLVVTCQCGMCDCYRMSLVSMPLLYSNVLCSSCVGYCCCRRRCVSTSSAISIVVFPTCYGVCCLQRCRNVLSMDCGLQCMGMVPFPILLVCQSADSTAETLPNTPVLESAKYSTCLTGFCSDSLHSSCCRWPLTFSNSQSDCPERKEGICHRHYLQACSCIAMIQLLTPS